MMVLENSGKWAQGGHSTGSMYLDGTIIILVIENSDKWGQGGYSTGSMYLDEGHNYDGVREQWQMSPRRTFHCFHVFRWGQ